MLTIFRVTFGPEKMIRIPPQHYCVIENPVLRNEKGEVIFDVHGQAKLQHADQEVRLAQEPFALYPGEAVKQVRGHFSGQEMFSGCNMTQAKYFMAVDGSLQTDVTLNRNILYISITLAVKVYDRNLQIFYCTQKGSGRMIDLCLNYIMSC